MSYHPVAREDGVHVLSEKCETCIFRPHNLMQLQQGRVKGMVEGAIEDQGTIPCHSTIYDPDVEPAICRGFWDSYRDRVDLLQLAERLDAVVYDNPPNKED